MSPLTPKQKAFIETYLANGFNATKAALSAGYSEKTARSQGARLLTNVVISEAVETRMKALAMGADEVLARLSEHARGDMADFIGQSQDALRQHPQARLIHKFKRTVHYEELPGGFIDEHIELELYDAQAVLLAFLKAARLDAGKPTESVIVFNQVPAREAEPSDADSS